MTDLIFVSLSYLLVKHLQVFRSDLEVVPSQHKSNIEAAGNKLHWRQWYLPPGVRHRCDVYLSLNFICFVAACTGL